MYNLELAGKKVTVHKSIAASGSIEFDEKGNVIGELTEKGEEVLLTVPGYVKGESPAKESLLAKEVDEDETETERQISALNVKLKDAKRTADTYKGEIDAMKGKIEEAEKVLKDSEAVKAENAELKKEVKELTAKLAEAEKVIEAAPKKTAK